MFATRIQSPDLHSICMTIAWATMYAQQKLDESHSQWADYFAYSEWFRHRICSHLNLPLNTEWEKIYKLTGCLVETEYPTEEAQRQAYSFGSKEYLKDEMVPAMFERFEEIKFRIVGRF